MRVVVAMSGGVDSSTVAGLLHEQGHEVVGVHLKLHDAAPGAGGSKTCCGDVDAADARRVAAHLGVPFYVLDWREAFRRSVIDTFVGAYRDGRTPNPCVACNGVLKFQLLLARAQALGAEALATGHYARVEDGRLLAAVDPGKDQSYFLFPIAREALARVRFPLGGLTKPEVRAHAARLGLPVAEKPESMDVCFVPDGDHAARIAAAFPDVDPAGELVDARGVVLGHHDAYWRFTVGQRRGLQLALGYPAYVTAIDPVTRRVTVAPEAALAHDGLEADGWTWLDVPAPGEVVGVRIRHRGPRVPAVVTDEGEGRVRVRFAEPARAVTPGQAAVAYRGDQVLGGGFVVRASAAAAAAHVGVAA